MEMKTLDAALVRKMFIAGAQALAAEKEVINALNVFPVPDGDTGTNMTMTITAAVEALGAVEEVDMAHIAKAISAGSLRGARGNSGVILSQLFRGFTKVIREYSELNAQTLSAAMQKGVDTAYKAVISPKEGTILTVAKAIASEAAKQAETAETMNAYFEAILTEGEAALANTPELLPVLKEAGVVDSGGKGLMTILHGCYDAFCGKEIDTSAFTAAARPAQKQRRAHIETDDIRFGYCTEFIVLLEKEFTDQSEAEMKKYLSSIGDSLVLVADEGMVKVHVHTNDPGLALQKGLQYGQLTRLKIDNMREEHRETLFEESSAPEPAPAETQSSVPEPADTEKEWKECAFLAVAAGEGMKEIFTQLGADFIVEGGQSMNPSTDDLLSAIEAVHAKSVFVLPNNKNIILAANQAAILAEGCSVYVIPTTTIPQGITALVNYVPEVSAEENAAQLSEDIKSVRSGEVTYAVRDTQIDGQKICEGDLIGIGDDGLLAVGSSMQDVVLCMLDKMADEDSELISVYRGADLPEEAMEQIAGLLQEKFPDTDIEISYGGQPVYYLILSVE